MQKLYIVIYNSNYTQIDTLKNCDLRKATEYVGFDYDDARTIYNSCVRYNSNARLYEVDLNDGIIKEHTPDDTLAKETEANKILRTFCYRIQEFGASIVRRMEKNGKISVSIEVELNTDKTGRRVLNEYTPKQEDIYKAYALAVECFVKENNTTIPLKLMSNGKTICQFNQK